MRVKNISISVGRTVNLGNFNSIRTELSIEADVDSEEYERSIEELHEVAEYNLEKIINKRINKISASDKERSTKNEEEFISEL